MFSFIGFMFITIPHLLKYYMIYYINCICLEYNTYAYPGKNVPSGKVVRGRLQQRYLYFPVYFNTYVFSRALKCNNSTIPPYDLKFITTFFFNLIPLTPFSNKRRGNYIVELLFSYFFP